MTNNNLRQLHQCEFPFSTLSKIFILTQKKGQLIILWTFQQHMGEWLWTRVHWVSCKQKLVFFSYYSFRCKTRRTTGYNSTHSAQTTEHKEYSFSISISKKKLYRINPDYFLPKFSSFLQLCSFIWGYHTTGKSCCLKLWTDWNAVVFLELSYWKQSLHSNPTLSMCQAGCFRLVFHPSPM